MKQFIFKIVGGGFIIVQAISLKRAKTILKKNKLVLYDNDIYPHELVPISGEGLIFNAQFL